MANSGRLKYSRLLLIINSGCTQLLRAAVLHQVNISNTEETTVTLDDYLYSKRSTLFPRDGRRNIKQEDRFELTIYPGFRKGTDIEKWDLQLLAFVALKLCDDPTLKMDINQLKKIRNRLCHSPNGVISDEQYESELQVIKIIFQRTLKTLTDEDTVNKLCQRFDALDIESEEILHGNSLRSLREWHDYEKVIEMNDKLDGLTEGQREIKETQYLMLQHLRANGKETLKLPEYPVVIGIKNCNLETQNKVSETLVSMFKSKINSHEQLQTDLTEGSRQILYDIISEIAEELAKSGKDIMDAYHGCVVLMFRCSSYEHLQELWNQAMNGSLTQMFRALQTALSEQYPGIQLDVFTTHTEWWRCVNTLIDNLSKYVPLDDNNAKIAEQLTTLDIKDPFACIQSATVEEPNHLQTDDYTKVNLRIIPRSSAHLQHLSVIHKVDTLRVKLEEASRALSKDMRSDVMIKLVPSEDSNEYDPWRPRVDEENPKHKGNRLKFRSSSHRESSSHSQHEKRAGPQSALSQTEIPRLSAVDLPHRQLSSPGVCDSPSFDFGVCDSPSNDFDSPSDDCHFSLHSPGMPLHTFRESSSHSALSQTEIPRVSAVDLPHRKLSSLGQKETRRELMSDVSQLKTPLKLAVDSSCRYLSYDIEKKRTGLVSDVSKSKIALKLLVRPSRPRDDREKYTASNRRFVSVKIPQDYRMCSIKGISQLPDGSFVVTDAANRKLKALDQSCRVTSYCSLPSTPNGVCYTVDGVVAAALRNRTIQFVSVGDKLTLRRSFSVTHACYGVAYCQDQLYISGGCFSAVYIYSLNGSQLRVVQTDASRNLILSKPRNIAASPSAVFVADYNEGLITMDSHGQVLSVFKPSDHFGASCVCLADDDTVFLAGHWSINVYQPGKKGTSKVYDVVTGQDMIRDPRGLCFDKNDHRLIVSQRNDDNLVIFDLEIEEYTRSTFGEKNPESRICPTQDGNDYS